MNGKPHISINWQFFWMLVAILVFQFNIVAQTKDSIKHLDEVEVQSQRMVLFNSGKKIIPFDSTILSMYPSSSLSELLSSQSSLHIKSYGPGNIATISFRGGNSNQTAVLWNGINIQNNMLGQNDLSLINSMLFDQIQIEYGAGSALWGSSAMSGAIHLNNTPLFNQGIKTKMFCSLGSYNTGKLTTDIQLSYKHWISITKLYLNTSENNYTYKDTVSSDKSMKRVSHADYKLMGLMQELYTWFGNYHKLSLRAWYHEGFRNLPSYTQVISKQSQADQNLKMMMEWKYQKRYYTSQLKGAYIHDVIDYRDSLSALYSISYSDNLMVEHEHFYGIKKHQFQFGTNYTFMQAHSPAYTGFKQVNKLSCFASYKWSGLKDKYRLAFNLRKEFSDLFQVPFTGNLGMEYDLNSFVSFKVNAAKSFRQPTLNDLFWNPGGNPNLKPENAIGGDAGMVLKYSIQKISLFFEGTYFNRYTKNWIIWLPQNGNIWTPRNLAEVYSRGIETNFHILFKEKKYFVKLYGNTSYVLSTNEKAINENDESVGRQLIYMPRYSLTGGLVIVFKDFNVLLNHSYTGYRFTSTDNASWLEPYQITNMKLTYALHFSSTEFKTYFAVNNMFNQSYQVVMNRPMMGRYYEIGINWTYQKIKHKNHEKNNN